MQYVGIDWAYRRAWCAMEAPGAVTGEGFVRADEDGLTRLVIEPGPEVRACLEMMSGAVWVRDRLAPSPPTSSGVAGQTQRPVPVPAAAAAANVQLGADLAPDVRPRLVSLGRRRQRLAGARLAEQVRERLAGGRAGWRPMASR
jgi:hypothetical protein